MRARPPVLIWRGMLRRLAFGLDLIRNIQRVAAPGLRDHHSVDDQLISLTRFQGATATMKGGCDMGGPKLPGLRSMTLTVTERCNLRCTYCYMPVTRGRAMDASVADAAVDLLAEHAAADGTVTLAFFGGEPFLAQDTVRRAAERAKPIGDGRVHRKP
jgi:sulfatase maturation enzyme AslB (radical SAM superfamily)